MDLQALSDRQEIADLITRYTRAIDTREWERLDDVFTPDARIDYSATGGGAGSFAEMKQWLADTLPMFRTYQHVVAQLDVDLDGDAATVAAYFYNPMVFAAPEPGDSGEQLWEVGGIYHHELVRTGAGWRSRHLVEELVWKRGF